MDIKEKLKASQGGGQDFVKLPIAVTLTMKEYEGKPMFCAWDKTNTQNIMSENPIIGIYIGGCMKLSAFDDNLGTSGGQYFSNYYFNREKICLFEPGKVLKIAVKGTLEEVTAWIAEHTTSKKPTKKWCFFILTAEGLVEIQSNLSIAIDQIKKNRDELTEKLSVFTPVIFNIKNTDISKQAKDILGKLATKNPPNYASLTVGDSISEKQFENWEASQIIELFLSWKKQITATPEKVEVQKKNTENNELSVIPDDLPFD